MAVRRMPVIVVAVFLLGLVGCSSSSSDDTTRDESGDIIEGGDVGVFALQEGDCLLIGDLGTAESAEVDEIEGVPCSEEHDGEVVLNNDAYYSGEEYPGEDEVVAQGSQACVEALEEYTGEPYADSAYEVVPLYPTESGWDSVDDRGLVCIGVTLNEDLTEIITTTGSIRA